MFVYAACSVWVHTQNHKNDDDDNNGDGSVLF